ncbi:MAG: hypothetical protein LJE68_17000 [Rhodobacter sp.]|nr:hypothetical protein [Rhodobacter sp.]
MERPEGAMLAALLLLGLLPLAALPMMQGEDVADAVPDDDGPSTGDEVDTTMLEDPGASGEPAVDPAEDGDVHSMDATPGETLIAGFEPGVDMVELDLTTVQGDVTYDTGITEQAATVSFAVGQGATTTISFAGLSEVPLGDIMLRMTDEDTGEPFEMSLGDAAASLNVTTVIGEVIGEVVDPIDPDNPDTPDDGGDAGVDPTTVVDPVDPDMPDDPGSEGGDPEIDEVLDPVDPEAEFQDADAGADPNGLPGPGGEGQAGQGAGDGTAVSDSAGQSAGAAAPDGGAAGDISDVAADAAAPAMEDADDMPGSDHDGGAAPEESNDLFWLYQGGADAGGVADVNDFVVGEDFLRVSLNPQISETTEPEVLVLPSGDGADGIVIVNGDLVAILRGAPEATAADVHAELRPDVFR